MNPAVEAAFIAAGSTAIVAIVGFLTTWATTTRTIKANSDNNMRALDAAWENNMRALDAAWEERLLEKKADAYRPVVAMLTTRRDWRQKLGRLLEQGGFDAPEKLGASSDELNASMHEFQNSMPAWTNLREDFYLLASLPVKNSHTDAMNADSALMICHNDLMNAQIEYFRAGSAGKPVSRRLTSALASFHDALERTQDADSLLGATITTDLETKPSQRLGLKGGHALVRAASTGARLVR
jgi:hypothetical protein